MFTGIVSKPGNFISLEKSGDPVLTIEMETGDIVKTGDSIAVNGACLTLIEKKGKNHIFNVSFETLKKTNFNDLKKGDKMNIELPLTLNDFVSGHLVSGHIDGTARTRSISKGKGSVKFTFTFSDTGWRKYIVHKGSVSVNGISLTVTEISTSFFSVEVLPLTLDVTNLKYLKIGERVNIELDLIGKYLYNQKPEK
ncbi:MAG: riboflavin synthase [Acidobacteriota bacterium]